MKRSMFMLIFIVGHIVFAGLQIHKHNKFAQLSYNLQKKEKIKEQLAEKKKQLVQERFALMDHKDIKEFAHTLGMSAVKINQVKKLKNNDTSIQS